MNSAPQLRHRLYMLRTKKPFLIAAALLAAAFIPAIASGQSTGSVKGKVKNLNGDGISGAAITARLGGKDVATAKSGSKGDFLLNGLESGVYNIVVDARGYTAGIKYGVEVKSGKTRDLGGNLILLVDRGTQVIVNGSVYYKDGTSLPGAEVRVERLNSDGSTRKIGTMFTSQTGEFTFRQAEGTTKFRITATHKGVSTTKELEVDSAAIYRLSLILDLERPIS